MKHVAGSFIRTRGIGAHRSILFVIALSVVIASGCAVPLAEKAAFEDFRGLERSRYPESARSELPALDEKATLGDFLKYAALNNPGLESAFYEWKAALEKVPQARTLPEPRVKYGYYLRDIEMRTGMKRQAFGLMQEFPWFGKLDLEGRMASLEAEAARQRYEAGVRKVFYGVKDAYAEYYYLQRVVDVTKDNFTLMKYLEQVVRARYMVAAATHPDVIRAQIELGRLDNELRTMQDMLRPAAAKLNAALGRAGDAPLPQAIRLPDAATLPVESELLSSMWQTNPELKEMGLDVQTRQKAVELAGKQYYPDLMLELDYMDMRTRGMAGDEGEPDEFMAGITVNLPIWRWKYRAAEAEAKARVRSAQKALADRRNLLESDARMAIFGVRDAERRINLYRDTLLPKAQESFKATEAAYVGGTADFLALLDAQKMLLEFQLSHERALADRVQRLAELEMLVGEGLLKTQDE